MIPVNKLIIRISDKKEIKMYKSLGDIIKDYPQSVDGILNQDICTVSSKYLKDSFIRIVSYNRIESFIQSFNCTELYNGLIYNPLYDGWIELTIRDSEFEFYSLTLDESLKL